MKVMYYEVGEPGRIVNIHNMLADMQKLVGGYIEVISIANDLVLVCNEEGIPMGLSVNDNGRKFVDYGDIVGDFFIARETCDGDFCDLTDEDIEWLRSI